MICIPPKRGATAWEGQLGRFWVHIRYPRYWKTSGFGFIRLVDKEEPAGRGCGYGNHQKDLNAVEILLDRVKELK